VAVGPGATVVAFVVGWLVGGFGATVDALAVGAGGGVDGTVVDSTGRVVVGAGAGVLVGVAGGFEAGGLPAGAVVLAGGLGVATGRSRLSGAPSRGSDSLMNRVFGGALTAGSGVGRGRALAGGSAWSGRSGSGRIALELTGPPARLTLISPP
jgi:hypothetical protein